jgi:outer membrane protein OmpA-like peptidoglycan-associated protein
MVTTAANLFNIEGLGGHSIAVTRHSVGHIITEWLMRSSSLSSEQIEQIRRRMVFTESSGETYEKLATGQADVAYLWEPYLTMASNLPGAKTLFTTRSATNLMMIGMVFREDYMNRYPEKIEQFIEGALRAGNEMPTELRYIREVDDYIELSDAEILAMSDYVVFANYAVNRELFNGTVQTLYKEMAAVWDDLGERTVVNGSQTGFDNAYLFNLASKFPDDKVDTPTFADTVDSNTPSNTAALLRQTLTINFEPNVAIIREESYPALAAFAQTATILNGAIIQVEGNIADTGVGDTATGRLLSEQRAKAVCDYLKGLGIDETRFVYKGNGINNPVPGVDPRSSAGMEANRRTDIFFLLIE